MRLDYEASTIKAILAFSVPLLLLSLSCSKGSNNTGNTEFVIKRIGSNAYTTDMSPVTVTLKSKANALVFIIPKAFLSEGDWQGGVRTLLDIKFTVNDMKPYAFAKIHEENSTEDAVFITVRNRLEESDYPQRSYQRLLNMQKIGSMAGLQAFQDNDRPQNCYRRDLVEKSPTASPELKEMLANSNDQYICWPYGDEYYTSIPNKNDRYIKLQCPPNNGMNNKMCSVTTSFNGWVLEYMFHSGERGNWKDYDNQVQSLLSGFSQANSSIKGQDAE